MEENLVLLQKIMILAIDITETQKDNIDFEFHSIIGKFQITIHYDGPTTLLKDGLSTTYYVSVTNTEALKKVLAELERIKIDSDFLGEL